MEVSNSEIDKIRTKIANHLARCLNIKEGCVTYLLPEYLVQGPKVNWAFSIKLRPEGENTGVFTYRGPWHENYVEAVKLAYEDLAKPLTISTQSDTRLNT